MEILCASIFIALFAYVIIAAYFNLADIFFARRYPYNDYTAKQLSELWKSYHRILPHGGIPLAGLASGVSLAILGIGFVAQIIYTTVQSLP